MSYTLKQNCICSSGVPACVQRWIGSSFSDVENCHYHKNRQSLDPFFFAERYISPRGERLEKNTIKTLFSACFENPEVMTCSHWNNILSWDLFLLDVFFQLALKILKWRLQSVIWKRVKRISTNSSYTERLINLNILKVSCDPACVTKSVCNIFVYSCPAPLPGQLWPRVCDEKCL